MVKKFGLLIKSNSTKFSESKQNYGVKSISLNRFNEKRQGSKCIYRKNLTITSFPF